MCSLDKSKQSVKTALLFELCINALKGSGFRFEIVYSQYKNSLIRDKKAGVAPKSSSKNIITDSVAESTAFVLKIATEICYAHPDYIDLVCADNSGISRIVSNFVLGSGFGSTAYLKKCLVDAPDELRELVLFTAKESKREKGTLLDKIKNLRYRMDELPEWMIKFIDICRDIIDWILDIPNWFRDLFEKIKEFFERIGDFFKKIFKK